MRTGDFLLKLLAVGFAACTIPTFSADAADDNAANAYRTVPTLRTCFCPSSHQNELLSSSAEFDAFLATAPCTSRGEGAEQRAKAWADQCRLAAEKAELNFEREALFYSARFFSSGMIKGTWEISGPHNGSLTVEIRRNQPKGPLTPDLGFSSTALIIDKALVQQIKTDDGGGNEVILRLEGPAGK